MTSDSASRTPLANQGTTKDSTSLAQEVAYQTLQPYTVGWEHSYFLDLQLVYSLTITYMLLFTEMVRLMEFTITSSTLMTWRRQSLEANLLSMRKFIPICMEHL